MPVSYSSYCIGRMLSIQSVHNSPVSSVLSLSMQVALHFSTKLNSLESTVGLAVAGQMMIERAARRQPRLKWGLGDVPFILPESRASF